MTFRLTTLAFCLLCFVAPAAIAQNLFAPAVEVNGRVITQFELTQRARLLRLFRAPGDPEEEAMRALVNERLQLEEAARMGITVSEEEVMEGMEEFAGRANLGRDEFVATLASDGIDVTTFEDFVRAGVAWRQVVRERFGPEAARITESDVEDEIRARPDPSLRVLLSEIILPANTPERAARAAELAPQISAIRGTDAFSAAAREYSASPSREQGGRLDWIPLDDLPAPLRAVLTTLQPGEVTNGVGLPNALAFFQLRGIEETDIRAPIVSIDYAAFYIPGGRTPEALATVAQLDAQVQTCEDLYGVASGLPPSRLQRDRLPPASIPADVALELAKLDANERSIALTRANGQTLVYLMLCERSYQPQDSVDDADRTAVREGLANARVSRIADAYLAELRANADITYR